MLFMQSFTKGTIVVTLVKTQRWGRRIQMQFYLDKQQSKHKEQKLGSTGPDKEHKQHGVNTGVNRNKV